MSEKICAIGCPPGKNLFRFPSREKDEERRKFWLDYFDMEEPNLKEVFACERHFSHFQATPKGIRRDAVPDVPVIYNTSSPPFRRKVKKWRPNVTIVTPRDPEYVIYRKQTGIFPQHNININVDGVQSLQMPTIKTVSYSTMTQTNTRLCGLVQISEFVDKYRLNCFYCTDVFPLEKWSSFVEHLKLKHFGQEEAFKHFKYISEEHDYTPIGLPSSNEIKNPKIYVKTDLMPKISSKPTTKITEPSQAQPGATLLNPTNDNQPFSITLADKLIKLLDETVLNPNFQKTKQKNMKILTSNIENLNNFIENKKVNLSTLPGRKSKHTSIKSTRPVYSLSGAQQNIAIRRNSIINVIKKSKNNVKYYKNMKNIIEDNNKGTTNIASAKDAEVSKRTVLQQHSSKNVKSFESVYKTIKSKPKVISSGVFYLKDIVDDKLTKRQIATKSALSRCLKRANTDILSAEDEEDYKPFTLQSLQIKPTELIFEYTPRQIIDFLLENMKIYPDLWTFHVEPFNRDYNEAIEKLCQSIKDKWSININSIKMCHSINRILKFYRCMRLGKGNNTFLKYFEKCSQFLPACVDDIPQTRCYLCFVCYKNDIDLRQHLIETHDALQWPFKCKDCKERFKENDEYELHKHLPHYEEFFTCRLCNKNFTRYYLYQKHLELHKRVQITESGKYPCNICQKEFKSRGELGSHRVYHGERKIKCPMCSKRFFKNTALKFHLKRHRKEHDVICEICGKGFIHQAYLSKHMDKHTGAKVTCNICNLKLRHCSLMRHLRSVHVACEGTIESTFRAKNHNYKRLLRPMTKPLRRPRNPAEKLSRQYICKRCNFRFERLKLLIEHNKELHSDDVKKWACKICNSEFGRIHNLKRHYREKHILHVYQVYKLVDQNEDLEKVLAIKTEELEKMSSTLAYSLLVPTCNKKKTIDTIIETTAIIKSDPSQDEIEFEQERMQSPAFSNKLMNAVDNITTDDIKVDDDNVDDNRMDDFFNDLLTQT